MSFQKEISEEQQRNWFRSIDHSTNFYLIITIGNNDVGVCNMKGINWDGRSGEGGIFIGDPRYLNTSVPVRAILNAATYFCDVLGIETVNISIVEGNEQAVHFNQMLGAVETSREDGLIRMYFTRGMLHNATSTLIEDIGSRYTEEERVLTISLERDFDKVLIQTRALQRLDHDPNKIQILT